MFRHNSQKYSTDKNKQPYSRPKAIGLIMISILLIFSIFLAGGCSSGSESSPTTATVTTRQSAQNESDDSSQQDGSTQADSAKAQSSDTVPERSETSSRVSLKVSDLPRYKGSSYVTVNGNIPSFTKKQKNSTKTRIRLGDLDSLGRCTSSIACLSTETMPGEEESRGEIGMIKPSGWQTVKYDCVEGKYLYNRCHCIGWMLSGLNAEERNLVTGTRYMNLEMLEHEEMVADYIRSTGNHVLYRITPLFVGNELLCRGLQMEAYSIEDHGKGICFNVFYYNVQPGISIDYSNGDSSYTGKFKDKTSAAVVYDADPSDTEASSDSSANSSSDSGLSAAHSYEEVTASDIPSDCSYVANTNTMKFHRPDCRNVLTMSTSNARYYTSSRDQVIADGFSPAGCCNP